MNITQLANNTHSDKGTLHGSPPHKYSYLYDLLFYPYRHLEINFLEMGLAVGGPELGGPVDRHVVSPSVRIWLEYFEKANIFGFDISDFSHMESMSPRFKFTRGDSGRIEDLRRLAAVAPSFQIVIDDASHASYHQQLAMKVLLPKVESGGLYIIEDLQWQSPAFEETMPQVPKTAQFLSEFFEDNKYTENRIFSYEDMNEFKSQIFSFASFPAFDGTGGVTKMFVFRKGVS